MNRYAIRNGRRYLKEGTALSVDLRHCLFGAVQEPLMERLMHSSLFPAWLVLDIKNNTAYWQRVEPGMTKNEELFWWHFETSPTMLQANKIYNSLVA